jgi:FkbM family methyltransferase
LYGLPFSRFGLEPGLVPFLPEGVPVTLVDIGAATGEFTAVVADHCGLRDALLIEPQPSRGRQLAERFVGERVTVVACAISDTAGAALLDILHADHSSSLLPVLPDVGGAGRCLDLSVRERVTVQTRTLDDVVDAAGFEGQIDLLKIDTQGAELHVLRGAPSTLRKVRLIWIEVSFVALYEGSALFAEVHGYLRNNGFRLYSLQEGFRGDGGELLQADALFLSTALGYSPT